MEDPLERFVVDTNVLINLNGFSKEVFPSLWSNFHEMVDNRQIFSVTEVQAELAESHGPVGEYWNQVDDNTDFYVDLEDEECKCLDELEDFEEFQKAGEDKPYFADPHLIAIAMSQKCTVLSDERKIDNVRSIPYICNQVGVKVMNLTEFMINQGWKW